MRMFTLLLIGFALSLASPGGAQQEGARLSGVYVALRTTTPMSTPEQEYLAFYPDGRVYHDDPDEGMAVPLDWAQVCRSTQCGTYSVTGGSVIIRWSSGGELRLQREPGGLLKREGSTRRFRPLAPLNGLRLEGVYALLGADGEVATGITFSRQGEFREFNLLPHTNWTMRGDPARRRHEVVGEGWGRYTIDRNTLELRYSNGLVARMMISVPPGVAANGDASTIMVNRTTLRRRG